MDRKRMSVCFKGRRYLCFLDRRPGVWPNQLFHGTECWSIPNSCWWVTWCDGGVPETSRTSPCLRASRLFSWRGCATELTLSSLHAAGARGEILQLDEEVTVVHLLSLSATACMVCVVADPNSQAMSYVYAWPWVREMWLVHTTCAKSTQLCPVCAWTDGMMHASDGEPDLGGHLARLPAGGAGGAEHATVVCIRVSSYESCMPQSLLDSFYHVEFAS
jgi:hypothetical protein